MEWNAIQFPFSHYNIISLALPSFHRQSALAFKSSCQCWPCVVSCRVVSFDSFCAPFLYVHSCTFAVHARQSPIPHFCLLSMVFFISFHFVSFLGSSMQLVSSRQQQQQRPSITQERRHNMAKRQSRDGGASRDMTAETEQKRQQKQKRNRNESSDMGRHYICQC